MDEGGGLSPLDYGVENDGLHVSSTHVDLFLDAMFPVEATH